MQGKVSTKLSWSPAIVNRLVQSLVLCIINTSNDKFPWIKECLLPAGSFSSQPSIPKEFTQENASNKMKQKLAHTIQNHTGRCSWYDEWYLAVEVVAAEVEAEFTVEEDAPPELPEPVREPRVPWELRNLVLGIPGGVGSCRLLGFLDKIITTRFMSGRSLGSRWAQRRPTWMHIATCSASAVGTSAGSISSRVWPFLWRFQAWEFIWNNMSSTL